MKLTNTELKLLAAQYETFEELLKNRKLYYLLHNRGILKEATKHMSRKIPRNQYSKPVVDFSKLTSSMVKYERYETWRDKELSKYVVLRRHGVDPKELFENKDDPNYIRTLLENHREQQLINFLEK